MRKLTLVAFGLMALAGAANAQGTSPAPPNADAGSIAGAGVGGAGIAATDGTALLMLVASVVAVFRIGRSARLVPPSVKNAAMAAAVAAVPPKIAAACANFPAATARRSCRRSARAPFIARCVRSASGLQTASSVSTYSARVGASAAVAKPAPSWDAMVMPAEVATVAPAAGTLVRSIRVTAERTVRSAFRPETTS